MFYKIEKNKEVLKELKKFAKKYETCDIKMLIPDGCRGEIIFFFGKETYKVTYLVDANKTSNIFLNCVYTKSNLFSILCSDIGFYIEKYDNTYRFTFDFEKEKEEDKNTSYVSQIIIRNKNKVWEHKELVSNSCPMFWG